MFQRGVGTTEDGVWEALGSGLSLQTLYVVG